MNTARGTFVDRTNFAARSQVQFANGADIENSNITDGSGKTFQNANARTAGNVNVNTGTSIARTDLMMVTANTVGANTSSFLDLDLDGRRASRPANVNSPNGDSGRPTR